MFDYSLSSINMINITMPASYPETLRHMHRPPNQLWMRGSWPDIETHKFLCVIGSRHASSYGYDACRQLISGLRGFPISIVSGLAIGMDGFAHSVALEAGLHCTAFPGSGLDWDVLYPSAQHDLARQILDAGGALASEYDPRFISTHWSFTARNRLMAGISHAVLIIEGREKSGTLSTANFALEFGRDVLVVPGSIFSDLSCGPIKLWSDGARPVCGSDEILEALGFTPAVRQSMALRRYDSLDMRYRAVIDAVRSGESNSEIIANRLAMPAIEFNSLLSELELDGLISVAGMTVRLN